LIKTHVVGRFLFFLSIFIVTNMINKEFALRLSNHLKFVQSQPVNNGPIQVVSDDEISIYRQNVKLSDAMDKLRGTVYCVTFSTRAVIQLLDAIN
jgi:hypothetical protein